MNPKVSKLISEYTLHLSDNDKYVICEELSILQRSFKWDQWNFSIELFERPKYINQLSEANLLRMFVVIIEKEKLSTGFFGKICKSGIIDTLIEYLKIKSDDKSLDSNKNCIISGIYDFRADTSPNRDPDQHSTTLKKYHKMLWTKSLPNGSLLSLSDHTPKKYLYHNSDLGEFNLTSDAITNVYRHTARMKDIIELVPKNMMQFIVNSLNEIGGYTLFPGDIRKGVQTINQARGCNQKILDRFDLTLECIRRFYNKQQSPLQKTFEGYQDFFNLFENFKSYVDFFLLQDFVLVDSYNIKPLLPFDETFSMRPFPENLQQYYVYIDNLISFTKNRTERILLNNNTTYKEKFKD